MTTKMPDTVFYDGDCPLCRSEMELLMRRNREDRLRFVDIAAPGFDGAGLGVTRDDLMALLHVRRPDGSWLVGVPAVQAVYAGTGHRLVAAALAHPWIAALARPAYAWLARHRYHLPRWMRRTAQVHVRYCDGQDACRLTREG